eukprot:SAG11_NODE_31406_length_292_cov_0.735751_1_plen_79_part_01
MSDRSPTTKRQRAGGNASTVMGAEYETCHMSFVSECQEGMTVYMSEKVAAPPTVESITAQLKCVQRRLELQASTGLQKP